MNRHPTHPRSSILVADNDIVLRSVLRALFARIGFDVTLLSEGGTMVAGIGRGRSLVLAVLDLDMPGGGLAACRALRADPDFDHVPVVILTGYGDEAIRRDCLGAGACLFLTKPFNPARLLTEIAAFLPLDAAGRAELSTIVAQDRGLQLRDVTASRALEPAS